MNQELRQEGVKEILQRAGLKLTPGRMALIELLYKEGKPLTQQEITEQLSEIDYNYVSVYRNLNSFMKKGIVHRVETGDRTWRFALSTCGCSRHCHPHFICRSCGRVECLKDLSIPEPPPVKPGYTVEEQEIYIRGLCKKCST